MVRPQRTIWQIFLLVILCATGCRLFQTAVDLPERTVRAVAGKQLKHIDPVATQQSLLRFADAFFDRTMVDLEKLRRGTNVPSPTELLEWKLALGSETVSIASGPNTVADVIDMTIFITVLRIGVEEYWQPKVFGESALPLLEGYRAAETNIWLLASGVLTKEQESELNEAVQAWRQPGGRPNSVLTARTLGFASEIVAVNHADKSHHGTLSSLLNIDPITGLDPAVREFAKTRLFAERALYSTLKLPIMLRWHAELLGLKTAENPAVQQFVTNTSQVATSVQHFSAIAVQLPDRLAAERQEIVKSLESQENKLRPLIGEVRESLFAGSQMSTSLNVTLVTFDSLMKRFGVGETNQNQVERTNSSPFRIQDYTQTAAQLEVTARRLTELLAAVDRTMGSTNLSQLTTQVTPVVRDVESSGKRVVDYAFIRAAWFVGIVFVAMFIYRITAPRLAGTDRKRSGPS